MSMGSPLGSMMSQIVNVSFICNQNITHNMYKLLLTLQCVCLYNVDIHFIIPYTIYIMSCL